MKNEIEIINEIEINGVVYVPKSKIKKAGVKLDGMEYAIVRSRNHGVLAGYVKSISGQTVELINSRRVWYFKGCETLEELAVYGTKNINECKICPVVEREVMLEACGVIYATEEGKKCIEGAKEWKR